MRSQEIIAINEAAGLVTNIDPNDVSENFCVDLRGGRIVTPGMVFVRDYGTRHRYDFGNYPVLSPGIISMIDGYNLYLPSENKEYDVIVGLDNSNNMRICVGDGNNWQELTEYFQATITAISGTSVTIGTIQTSLGQSINLLANYLVNYIGVIDNVPSTGAGLITANTAISGGLVTLTLINQASTALSWAVGNTLKIYRSTGLLPDSILGTTLGKNGSGRGFKYANGVTPHTRFLSVEDQQKVNLYYGDSTNSPVMRQPVQIRRGNYLAPGSFTLLGQGWSDFADVSQAGASAMTGVSTYTTGGIKYVWICKGQSIYTANDGGTGTWTALTAQTIFSGLKGNLRGIKMLSNTVGFAVGLGGTVLSWDNGNSRWKDASTDVGSNDLYCLSVFSSTVLWVAGAGGKMFKTTDGGASWTILSSGTTKDIITIQFVDASNGYFGATNYGIAKSTNAGSTWVLDGAAGVTINSVSLLSVSSGYAISQDGGVYYKNTASGWTQKSSIAGYSVYGFTADTAKITGLTSVFPYRPLVYTVANASTSFDITTDVLPIESGTILASSFYDATNGFAVRNNGRANLLTAVGGTLGDKSASGWTIQKAGMQPDFVSFGSKASPMHAGDSVTKDCGEGIRIKVDAYQFFYSATAQISVKMYVTAIYADYTFSKAYQESDPIAQIFQSPTALTFLATPTITISLDLALVNKNLIGFRFYHAKNHDETTPAVRWQESAADYLLAYELTTSTRSTADDSTWVYDPTKQYSLSKVVTEFQNGQSAIDNLVVGAQATILSNLGHVPVLNREYLTPRYAIKLGRTQGAVIFVDEDDRTLRRSEYSGSGAHMDDSFPAVTVDNLNDQMTLFMIGRGELYGLAQWNNSLLAFHSSELEIRDITADQSDLLAIDLASKKSILGVGIKDAPLGVTWQGYSGIYILEIGGFTPKLLNKDIANIHDGTLTLTNGVPIVSDSYKTNVLSGYDRFYQEIYYQFQQNVEGGGTEWVSYRYNIRYKKWMIRKFNIGTDGQIRFMYAKKNNSFNIGYGTGLLAYPNRITSGSGHIWEDDVSLDGTSAGKGIETRVRFNDGSFYGLSKQAVVNDVFIDHDGSSVNGNGKFYAKLYANQFTTPFDSKTFPIDKSPSRRGLQPVGMTKNVQIEVGVDPAETVNVKDFEISLIEIGANIHEKTGVI